MTIPNKLTLSRFLLTPVFALCFYMLHTKGGIFFALAVALLYAYMEISDLLDGKIARKYHLVTDLGKVFDPFSDCFMHLSFFALFAYFKMISLTAFLFILWRELSITFTRMLLMKSNVVLPANIFGKFKTVFYAFLTFVCIVYEEMSVFFVISPESGRLAYMLFFSLSYLAAFFSVLSFTIYFSKILSSHALDSITR